MEHHGGSSAARKCRERSADLLLTGQVGDHRSVVGAVEPNEATEATNDTECLTGLDLEQPCRKSIRIAQAMQLAQGDLEGRLKEILGLGIVERNDPGRRKEHWPVLVQDLRRHPRTVELSSPQHRFGLSLQGRYHSSPFALPPSRRQPERRMGERDPR